MFIYGTPGALQIQVLTNVFTVSLKGRLLIIVKSNI